MDVHVPAAVTEALLLKGIDVLTAQRDGATRTLDPILLDRATRVGRVLVTQDEDFLVEAAVRQTRGIFFAGIIFAAQNRISIGRFVSDLELIAHCSEPKEFFNHLEYLPLD